MDKVFSSHSISQLPQHANSKWVTRARPKIDRVACPWLIRRFIALFKYKAGIIRVTLACGAAGFAYTSLL